MNSQRKDVETHNLCASPFKCRLEVFDGKSSDKRGSWNSKKRSPSGREVMPWTDGLRVERKVQGEAATPSEVKQSKFEVTEKERANVNNFS